MLMWLCCWCGHIRAVVIAETVLLLCGWFCWCCSFPRGLAAAWPLLLDLFFANLRSNEIRDMSFFLFFLPLDAWTSKQEMNALERLTYCCHFKLHLCVRCRWRSLFWGLAKHVCAIYAAGCWKCVCFRFESNLFAFMHCKERGSPRPSLQQVQLSFLRSFFHLYATFLQSSSLCNFVASALV